MRRRIGALSLGIALLAALAVGTGALPGEDGDRRLQAEFENARGILEGNDVRIQGVKAGSVEAVELTERGTAIVSMSLDAWVPTPRSDAAATIRPVDLLGDIYLSLSLGEDPMPLRGPIRVSRTSNVPRLAELLRAFRPSVRVGLRAMLVELSLGLEQRGVDLNRAAVELRPMIEAGDGLMRELSSQRASLRSLISNSQHLAAELAGRDRDLGRMVHTFADTLQATADRRTELDAGLERLPPVLVRLEATARGLERTATAARPLAAAVRDAAPDLGLALARLPPFVRATREAVRDLRPTLRRTSAFLSAGSESFPALSVGLRGLTDAAPSIDDLTDALVPVAPLASEVLLVNLPDQAAEPGTQPFDPFADPRRRYWRGAAVLSCESFGRQIEPGCLDDFNGARTSRSRPRSRSTRAATRTRRGGDVPGVPQQPEPGPPRQDGADRPPATAQQHLLDYLLGP